MRILEPEAMLLEDEVIAYDVLVRKYLLILHAGFVESVLNLSTSNGSFLDVGTGTGWIAIGVAKYNPTAKVTGVDLSETMLKVARTNAEAEGVSKRIDFVKGDAKNLPFEKETFDSVFCHNMLHHIPKPIEMLAEMVRVSKKEGALLVRDLIRASKFLMEFDVNILGFSYPKIMKQRYKESILAALSPEEWNDLFKLANIPGSRLTKQFHTHMSIEKPSENRRKQHLKIPTPFFLKAFKNLYVSF